MKVRGTATRVQSLKSVLRHPGVIVAGTQRYIFAEGHFGKVPLSPVSSLFAEIGSEIKMQSLESEVEGVTITELGVLSWIARNVVPATVFEFGTANGRTSLNLALNTPEQCKIYTLDLPREQRQDYHEQEIRLFGEHNFGVPFRETAGGCFRDHPVAGKITQLYGDSTQLDYTLYHGKMDLIFIDANHDYPCVKSDTENALKMLSERGTVVWHDYPNWEGVWRCLDELLADGLPLYRIQGTSLVCHSRLFRHE